MRTEHRLLFFAFLFLLSCSGDPEEKNTAEQNTPVQPEEKFVPVAPAFNEDSAYFFVKKQVAFGPRVPGTKAHAACARFLEEKLKQYGFKTQIQSGEVKTFDGKTFSLKNIIGSFKPEASSRILLCAHWDTRPFADNDIKDLVKPIDGADDGASGVGVLLETARQIQLKSPESGIDIIFFDLEDYGQPSETLMSRSEDSWCLGSQYWGKNPHNPGYKADFGILLDMVGARGAEFPREGTSLHYAPQVLDRVWSVAAKLGYSNRFVNRQTGPTTDDHTYINEYTSIPTIAIVYMDSAGGYGPHHHTHKDNLDIIDKQTLKIVGQTVLETIYRHGNQQLLTSY